MFYFSKDTSLTVEVAKRLMSFIRTLFLSDIFYFYRPAGILSKKQQAANWSKRQFAEWQISQKVFFSLGETLLENTDPETSHGIFNYNITSSFSQCLLTVWIKDSLDQQILVTHIDRKSVFSMALSDLGSNPTWS